MNTLELNKFHVFVAMAMLTTRGANDTGMGFNWIRLGLQQMLDSFGYSIDSTIFEVLTSLASGRFGQGLTLPENADILNENLPSMSAV